MKGSELIWQIAVVRLDDKGRRWLEYSDPAGCDKCSTGTGCGAALFSRLFARPDTRIPLSDDNHIPAGHVVRVGLDPRWLLLASAATYLLPVIAFVAGALFADRLFPGSDPAALFAGIALALTAGLAAHYPMKLIDRPRLELVELHEGLESNGLESGDDSGHLSGQDR